MFKKHHKNKSRLAALKVLVPLGILLIITILCIWYLNTHNIQVLNTKGPVATQERSLMAFTIFLGGIVVVPVFIIAVIIAWRYREKNHTAKYTPEADNNKIIEFIWWAIPIILIIILASVTWISTYKLDPYKSLAANSDELTIDVVSLDWKWLFIYPKQNIATVNFVQFPVNTPVHFNLTSDTVMNSFWIPQLSGQIYSMPGMTTELNVQAGSPGDYDGSSANISGEGFAGMKFTARASTQTDFDNWIKYAQKSSMTLDSNNYSKLSQNSKNNPVAYYSSVDSDLFDNIVKKYMMPMKPNNESSKSSDDHKAMPKMNSIPNAGGV